MRPLIGITSYAEEIRWGVWTEEAALVPLAYVRAVEEAGGRPLVVPPSEDGPELYGAEAHDATDTPRKERDAAELRLLEAALERDMPVLAICRGSQLLNVVRGGDLEQHLPETVGHQQHRHDPGSFSDHDVKVAADSRLGGLLGDRAPVKSHHHQGYGRIGSGLREVAWAEDGVVEGLEDADKRFALAVLWHPEEGEDLALFEGLIEEARRYRQERA